MRPDFVYDPSVFHHAACSLGIAPEQRIDLIGSRIAADDGSNGGDVGSMPTTSRGSAQSRTPALPRSTARSSSVASLDSTLTVRAGGGAGSNDGGDDKGTVRWVAISAIALAAVVAVVIIVMMIYSSRRNREPKLNKVRTAIESHGTATLANVAQRRFRREALQF